MTEKIEKAKFVIGRLDNYIEGTNSKGNFILASNAVVIGGILTGFAFSEKLEISCIKKVFLALSIVFGTLSCLFTLLAIIPFIKSIGKKNYKSLFFFKDIITFRQDDYINFLNQQTPQEEFNDLSAQIFNISEGLNGKFKKMRVSIIFLFVEIVFISLYILNIIIP